MSVILSVMETEFGTWQDAALGILRVLHMMRTLCCESLKAPEKWAEYCVKAKMPQAIAEELLTCYNSELDELSDPNKFYKMSYASMLEGNFYDHKN